MDTDRSRSGSSLGQIHRDSDSQDDRNSLNIFDNSQSLPPSLELPTQRPYDDNLNDCPLPISSNATISNDRYNASNSSSQPAFADRPRNSEQPSCSSLLSSPSDVKRESSSSTFASPVHARRPLLSGVPVIDLDDDKDTVASPVNSTISQTKQAQHRDSSAPTLRVNAPYPSFSQSSSNNSLTSTQPSQVDLGTPHTVEKRSFIHSFLEKRHSSTRSDHHDNNDTLQSPMRIDSSDSNHLTRSSTDIIPSLVDHRTKPGPSLAPPSAPPAPLTAPIQHSSSSTVQARKSSPLTPPVGPQPPATSTAQSGPAPRSHSLYRKPQHPPPQSLPIVAHQQPQHTSMQLPHQRPYPPPSDGPILPPPPPGFYSQQRQYPPYHHISGQFAQNQPHHLQLQPPPPPPPPPSQPQLQQQQQHQQQYQHNIHNQQHSHNHQYNRDYNQSYHHQQPPFAPHHNSSQDQSMILHHQQQNQSSTAMSRPHPPPPPSPHHLQQSDTRTRRNSLYRNYHTNHPLPLANESSQVATVSSSHVVDNSKKAVDSTQTTCPPNAQSAPVQPSNATRDNPVAPSDPTPLHPVLSPSLGPISIKREQSLSDRPSSTTQENEARDNQNNRKKRKNKKVNQNNVQQDSTALPETMQVPTGPSGKSTQDSTQVATDTTSTALVPTHTSVPSVPTSRIKLENNSLNSAPSGQLPLLEHIPGKKSPSSTSITHQNDDDNYLNIRYTPQYNIFGVQHGYPIDHTVSLPISPDITKFHTSFPQRRPPYNMQLSQTHDSKQQPHPSHGLFPQSIYGYYCLSSPSQESLQNASSIFDKMYRNGSLVPQYNYERQKHIISLITPDQPYNHNNQNNTTQKPRPYIPDIKPLKSLLFQPSRFLLSLTPSSIRNMVWYRAEIQTQLNVRLIRSLHTIRSLMVDYELYPSFTTNPDNSTLMADDVSQSTSTPSDASLQKSILSSQTRNGSINSVVFEHCPVADDPAKTPFVIANITLNLDRNSSSNMNISPQLYQVAYLYASIIETRTPAHLLSDATLDYVYPARFTSHNTLSSLLDDLILPSSSSSSSSPHILPPSLAIAHFIASSSPLTRFTMNDAWSQSYTESIELLSAHPLPEPTNANPIETIITNITSNTITLTARIPLLCAFSWFQSVEKMNISFNLFDNPLFNNWASKKKRYSTVHMNTHWNMTFGPNLGQYISQSTALHHISGSLYHGPTSLQHIVCNVYNMNKGICNSQTDNDMISSTHPQTRGQYIDSFSYTPDKHSSVAPRLPSDSAPISSILSDQLYRHQTYFTSSHEGFSNRNADSKTGKSPSVYDIMCYPNRSDLGLEDLSKPSLRAHPAALLEIVQADSCMVNSESILQPFTYGKWFMPIKKRSVKSSDTTKTTATTSTTTATTTTTTDQNDYHDTNHNDSMDTNDLSGLVSTDYLNESLISDVLGVYPFIPRAYIQQCITSLHMAAPDTHSSHSRFCFHRMPDFPHKLPHPLHTITSISPHSVASTWAVPSTGPLPPPRSLPKSLLLEYDEQELLYSASYRRNFNPTATSVRSNRFNVPASTTTTTTRPLTVPPPQQQSTTFRPAIAPPLPPPPPSRNRHSDNTHNDDSDTDTEPVAGVTLSSIKHNYGLHKQYTLSMDDLQPLFVNGNIIEGNMLNVTAIESVRSTSHILCVPCNMVLISRVSWYTHRRSTSHIDHTKQAIPLPYTAFSTPFQSNGMIGRKYFQTRSVGIRHSNAKFTRSSSLYHIFFTSQDIPIVSRPIDSNLGKLFRETFGPHLPSVDWLRLSLSGDKVVCIACRSSFNRAALRSHYSTDRHRELSTRYTKLHHHPYSRVIPNDYFWAFSIAEFKTGLEAYRLKKSQSGGKDRCDDDDDNNNNKTKTNNDTTTKSLKDKSSSKHDQKQSLPALTNKPQSNLRTNTLLLSQESLQPDIDEYSNDYYPDMMMDDDVINSNDNYNDNDTNNYVYDNNNSDSNSSDSDSDYSSIKMVCKSAVLPTKRTASDALLSSTDELKSHKKSLLVSKSTKKSSTYSSSSSSSSSSSDSEDDSPLPTHLPVGSQSTKDSSIPISQKSKKASTKAASDLSAPLPVVPRPEPKPKKQKQPQPQQDQQRRLPQQHKSCYTLVSSQYNDSSSVSYEDYKNSYYNSYDYTHSRIAMTQRSIVISQQGFVPYPSYNDTLSSPSAWYSPLPLSQQCIGFILSDVMVPTLQHTPILSAISMVEQSNTNNSDKVTPNSSCLYDLPQQPSSPFLPLVSPQDRFILPYLFNQTMSLVSSSSIMSAVLAAYIWAACLGTSQIARPPPDLKNPRQMTAPESCIAMFKKLSRVHSPLIYQNTPRPCLGLGPTLLIGHSKDLIQQAFSAILSFPSVIPLMSFTPISKESYLPVTPVVCLDTIAIFDPFAWISYQPLSIRTATQTYDLSNSEHVNDLYRDVPASYTFIRDSTVLQTQQNITQREFSILFTQIYDALLHCPGGGISIISYTSLITALNTDLSIIQQHIADLYVNSCSPKQLHTISKDIRSYSSIINKITPSCLFSSYSFPDEIVSSSQSSPSSSASQPPPSRKCKNDTEYIPIPSSNAIMSDISIPKNPDYAQIYQAMYPTQTDDTVVSSLPLSVLSTPSFSPSSSYFRPAVLFIGEDDAEMWNSVDTDRLDMITGSNTLRQSLEQLIHSRPPINSQDKYISKKQLSLLLSYQKRCLALSTIIHSLCYNFRCLIVRTLRTLIQASSIVISLDDFIHNNVLCVPRYSLIQHLDAGNLLEQDVLPIFSLCAPYDPVLDITSVPSLHTPLATFQPDAENTISVINSTGYRVKTSPNPYTRVILHHIDIQPPAVASLWFRLASSPALHRPVSQDTIFPVKPLLIRSFVSPQLAEMPSRNKEQKYIYPLGTIPPYVAYKMQQSLAIHLNPSLSRKAKGLLPSVSAVPLWLGLPWPLTIIPTSTMEWSLASTLRLTTEQSKCHNSIISLLQYIVISNRYFSLHHRTYRSSTVNSSTSLVPSSSIQNQNIFMPLTESPYPLQLSSSIRRIDQCIESQYASYSPLTSIMIYVPYSVDTTDAARLASTWYTNVVSKLGKRCPPIDTTKNNDISPHCDLRISMMKFPSTESEYSRGTPPRADLVIALISPESNKELVDKYLLSRAIKGLVVVEIESSPSSSSPTLSPYSISKLSDILSGKPSPIPPLSLESILVEIGAKQWISSSSDIFPSVQESDTLPTPQPVVSSTSPANMPNRQVIKAESNIVPLVPVDMTAATQDELSGLNLPNIPHHIRHHGHVTVIQCDIYPHSLSSSRQPLYSNLHFPMALSPLVQYPSDLSRSSSQILPLLKHEIPPPPPSSLSSSSSSLVSLDPGTQALIDQLKTLDPALLIQHLLTANPNLRSEILKAVGDV